jgi:CheY-like chemotaxis protein
MAIRVLVVDDTRSLRARVVRALGKEQIPAVEAVDGIDAIMKAREAALAGEPFTVAFLDLSMPNLGGADAGVLLKAQYPEMGIVLLTGNDTAFEMGLAKFLGAGFMIKALKGQTSSPHGFSEQAVVQQAILHWR